MSVEETVNYRIQYDVRGLDDSIRGTQKVLYFMNATRLAVVDLQQVMSGMTLSNVMWTSVQLTRVWTHLYRLVKKTNQAQRVGMVQGVIGGARGTATSRVSGVMGTNLAMNALFDPTWQPPANKSLWQLMVGFASANPYVTGGIVTAIAVAGIMGYDMRQKKIHREWQKRQREIAKSQGLEN